MADLLARFKLIDEMSQKMTTIANAGTNMLNSWTSTGQAMNNSLAGIDDAASGVARSIDGAAQSVNDLNRASSGVSGSASALSSAMDNVQESASGAAAETDYWTDAIGSYDKGAMEAVYTTEELVEMGFKTQDALEAEAKAADKAADSADELGDAAEESGEKQEEMGKKGADALQTVSDALAAAGIIKLVHEIGQAFMDAALDAEKFETSIAQLQTIAGAEHLGELTADINALSRETGIAASDLANVAYNAISAGAAVEDAVGTAEAASKLATAGFTDTSSALSVLSTAMNAYGDAAGTATDISDSLIMVQNLGVTTVADLSQQIGRAIAVASGYSVSLGNLEAAYISTTKAGINTAQSTTYISGMLNELGSASSEVSSILIENTGQSFGQLMQSGSSLADVLGVLYDSVNGDTEAFMNLWGSSTAGMAAAAIINQGLEEFNTNLQAVENSAGATEEAYSIMADTTEFAHQRMTNSMNQVSIAFGSTLNPALEKVYNAVSDVSNAVAGFIEEHPTVTKAVSAIAIGLGVAATAIVGVTTVVNVLIPAIAGLGTAINAAMGPIGWIAIGIAAVTTAVVAFTAMMETAEDETLSMTATTKAQYDELQNLQAEYENACGVYGETSEEASRLKYQLDDLTSAYESNKQTVEELCAEVDKVIDSHNKMMDSINSNEQSIKNEEVANLALIAKLADMASSTDQAAASQAAMKSILNELNGSIEGVNVSYDDLINNQEGAVKTLREYAQAQAEQEMRQQKLQDYIELIKQQATEEQELAKVRAEVEAATIRSNEANQEYLDYYTELTKYDFTGMAGIGAIWSSQYKEMSAASDNLEAVTDKYNELEAALAETNATIAQMESEWDTANAATNAAGEAAITYEQAAAIAFQGVQDEIMELCQAYDDAYESARNSIDGMYGLFDEANTRPMENAVRGTFGLFEEVELEAEHSAKELVGILEKQTEAYVNYASNLAAASDYGIDGGLLESLSDGSEDSMANLQAIIGYINSLGAESEQAQAYINSLNEAFSNNQAAQDYFDTASNSADEFITNLQSQSEAINQYVENLQRAQEIGLDESLVTALSDGSEESAAQLQAIIDKVDELGESSTEAQAFIDEMNTAFEGVQTAKDSFASTVAEMQTDFSAKMAELTATMESTIDGLNLDSEAAAAASATISAYTAEIQAQGESAVAAAQSIANRVSAALSSASGTVSVGVSAPGHARGTDYAEDIFIAGEEGPELVVGHEGAQVFTADETARILRGAEPQEQDNQITSLIGVLPAFWSWVDKISDKLFGTQPEPANGLLDGLEAFASGTTDSPDTFIAGDGGPELVVGQPHSTVFPTDETERIISAVEDTPIQTEGDTSNEESNVKTNGTSGGAAEDSKRIFLEIAGSGAIDVSARTDKNAVLEIIQDHIKPVLVSIIQQEIYEEGELSYEY